MTFLSKKGALGGLCAGLAAAAFQVPASASLNATLTDTYTGGIDPYAFVQSKNSDGTPTTDSVGGGVFNISGATVNLNGSQLTVTINTAFAGVPGTAAAQGTNYGDLLLGTAAKYSPITNANAATLAADWNSVLPKQYQVTASSSVVTNTVAHDNSAGGDLGDVYDANDQKNGEWGYAVDMLGANGKPLSTSAYPTVGANGIATGQVALYSVLNPYTTLVNGGGMVLSNAGGCATTKGIDNSCSDYYRAGEAVQYIPETNQQAIALGTYTIDEKTGTITYTFSEANTGLGDNFAISWAMTCANDIIQGMVNLPEPGTWAMLVIGMAGLGGLRWRTRRVRQG